MTNLTLVVLDVFAVALYIGGTLGMSFLIAMSLAMLNRRARETRCAWCYRPYAFWRRAGSACCRRHSRIIDSEISRLVRQCSPIARVKPATKRLG